MGQTETRYEGSSPYLFRRRPTSVWGFGYLRVVNNNDDIHVTLLMAKAQVFPLNEKQSELHGSMPCKELMAALLASELSKILKEALTDMDLVIFLWTDSFSVQRWCFNKELKLNVFVANRVGKILNTFEPTRLRWVDGKSNSADQLSWGLRGDERGRWLHFLHGPSWLALPEEFWP